VTAGIAAPSEAAVSATARVRHQLQQDYSGRDTWLPLVVRSDGARTIRCPLEALFGQPVPLSLAWYHLEKKVAELRGMGARHTQEQAAHIAYLLRHRWHGRTEAARAYLRRAGQAKNPAP
jgi:hypothetical protein